MTHKPTTRAPDDEMLAERADIANRIMAELMANPETYKTVLRVLDPEGLRLNNYKNLPDEATYIDMFVRQYALGVAEDEQTSGLKNELATLPAAFARVKQFDDFDLSGPAPQTSRH